MALMANFQDALTANSLDTTLWTEFTTAGGTTSYDSEGASMKYPNPTSTSNDADIASVGTYDLTGSFGRINVLNAPSGANSDATFKLRAGSNLNDVHWQNEGTSLFAAYIVGGAQTILATLTYSPSTHAWWQIREKGGTTYWETSSDGITWTTRASTANKITMTALTVDLAATSFGVDSGLTDFKFRYFNYPLPGTTTSTSSTSTSSTSTSTSSTSTSISSTSHSTSSTSTSTSSTSISLSTSSTSMSISSTSSSTSSTSTSLSSTSSSSTSQSTSVSSTSTSISSTSVSSTSQSSTSSSSSISSTSTSLSSVSSSTSSTSHSTSSTSTSVSSTSSSISTTTIPPNIDYTYQDAGALYITATDLATYGGSAATIHNTIPVTPAPNKLILIWISTNHNASGTVDPTSVTGCNLTWVKVTSVPNALGANTISVWRAMGVNPTAGAITINWDASVSVGYSIVQYDGVNTSGTNGSGAIGVTNVNFVTGGSTSLDTPTTFGSTDSATVAGMHIGNSDVISGRGGMAITNQNSQFVNVSSAFNNGNILTPGFGWTNSSSNANTITLELLTAANADLTNKLTPTNYSNESVDDGDYFIQYGSKTIVQEFKKDWTNNTDNISFTFKGRTTLSTLVSPIIIQIYNQTTPSWETMAVINKIPVDTDFTQTVTKSTNVSNYYDSSAIVTFRVYQRVN